MYTKSHNSNCLHQTSAELHVSRDWRVDSMLSTSCKPMAQACVEIRVKKHASASKRRPAARGPLSMHSHMALPFRKRGRSRRKAASLSSRWSLINIHDSPVLTNGALSPTSDRILRSSARRRKIWRIYTRRERSDRSLVLYTSIDRWTKRVWTQRNTRTTRRKLPAARRSPTRRWQPRRRSIGHAQRRRLRLGSPVS